jgi:hypothetical protein
MALPAISAWLAKYPMESSFPDARSESRDSRCHGRQSHFLACAATVFMAVVCGTGAARATQTEAYLPIAQSYTTATLQGGEVAGCTYQATQDITFNSLGFIDVNTNLSNYNYFNTPDGLLGTYQVGIWLNSTQTLLASATVTPSSPLGLNSQFRYAPIPATTILAGQSFTVAALLPASPSDAWLTNYVSSNMTGISGPGTGVYLAGNTLSFPTQNGGSDFAVANASTAVVAPEPTATTCLLLALGGLAMLRHRRRAIA